jgi:translation initiation factor IF-3
LDRVFINNQIRAKEVRVVDETGSQLGVMEIFAAIDLAKSKGLDLIQVTEKAVPPVCRIMDYSKFLYQQQKKEKEMRHHQKGGELKEIRLTFAISDHDIETKARKAEEFLKDGDKVKIDMRLRGREKALQGFAREKIKKFVDTLEKLIPLKLERDLKREASSLTMIISAGAKKSETEKK